MGSEIDIAAHEARDGSPRDRATADPPAPRGRLRHLDPEGPETLGNASAQVTRGVSPVLRRGVVSTRARRSAMSGATPSGSHHESSRGRVEPMAHRRPARRNQELPVVRRSAEQSGDDDSEAASAMTGGEVKKLLSPKTAALGWNRKLAINANGKIPVAEQRAVLPLVLAICTPVQFTGLCGVRNQIGPARVSIVQLLEPVYRCLWQLNIDDYTNASQVLALVDRGCPFIRVAHFGWYRSAGDYNSTTRQDFFCGRKFRVLIGDHTVPWELHCHYQVCFKRVSAKLGRSEKRTYFHAAESGDDGDGREKLSLKGAGALLSAATLDGDSEAALTRAVERHFGVKE